MDHDIAAGVAGVDGDGLGVVGNEHGENNVNMLAGTILPVRVTTDRRRVHQPVRCLGNVRPVFRLSVLGVNNEAVVAPGVLDGHVRRQLVEVFVVGAENILFRHGPAFEYQVGNLAVVDGRVACVTARDDLSCEERAPDFGPGNGPDGASPCLTSVGGFLPVRP